MRYNDGDPTLKIMERKAYTIVAIRTEPLKEFRRYMPKASRLVYQALLQEAIASPQLRAHLGQMKPEWSGTGRGLIQLSVSDRPDYDRYLDMVACEGTDAIFWSSVLVQAFLDCAWIREAVGRRMLRY